MPIQLGTIAEEKGMFFRDFDLDGFTVLIKRNDRTDDQIDTDVREFKVLFMTYLMLIGLPLCPKFRYTIVDEDTWNNAVRNCYQ